MSNHPLPVDESGHTHRDEPSGASFREKAKEYLGGARVQEFADAATEHVNEAADYLRNTGAERMKADVESLVKSNPGPAMLVAATVGFLIGRSLLRR